MAFLVRELVKSPRRVAVMTAAIPAIRPPVRAQQRPQGEGCLLRHHLTVAQHPQRQGARQRQIGDPARLQTHQPLDEPRRQHRLAVSAEVGRCRHRPAQQHLPPGHRLDVRTPRTRRRPGRWLPRRRCLIPGAESRGSTPPATSSAWPSRRDPARPPAVVAGTAAGAPGEVRVGSNRPASAFPTRSVRAVSTRTAADGSVRSPFDPRCAGHTLIPSVALGVSSNCQTAVRRSASADRVGTGRSRRSSPRSGKPATWRRAAAGFWQKGAAIPEDVGVNGPAPHARVREMQAKLHRWAVADPGRRFGDLYAGNWQNHSPPPIAEGTRLSTQSSGSTVRGHHATRRSLS